MEATWRGPPGRDSAATEERDEDMGGRDGVLIGRRLVVRPLMRSSPVFSFLICFLSQKPCAKFAQPFCDNWEGASKEGESKKEAPRGRSKSKMASRKSLRDTIAHAQLASARESAERLRIVATLDEGEEDEVAVCFYERLVGLFHEMYPDDGHLKAPTAKRLLEACGLDSRSALATEAEQDAFLDQIRGAELRRDEKGEEIEYEEEMDSDNAANGYRAEAKRLVALMCSVAVADEEAKVKSIREKAVAGTGQDKKVELKQLTKEERQDERYARSTKHLAMHVPAPKEYHATYQPSRGLVLAFPEYKTLGMQHSIPKLSDLLKLGRAQEVPKGRESALAEMKAVLLALRVAYASEMPGLGPEYVAADGKTRFKVVVADDDSEDGKRTESRAPVLSAHAVDEAIEAIDGALHCLTSEQQREVLSAFWTDFQGLTLAPNANRRPLTSCLLKAAMGPESAITAAIKMVRPSNEARPKTIARAGDKRKLRPSETKGAEITGAYDATGPARAPFDVAGLPPCPTWVRTGSCALHAKRKCLKYRHYTEDIKKEAEE
jgi:hypothetical protein